MQPEEEGILHKEQNKDGTRSLPKICNTQESNTL